MDGSGHGCRDADVACDTDAQAGTLDLDLGEVGLSKQQRELANEDAVVALGVALGFCG
jgi:hypothetical protein